MPVNASSFRRPAPAPRESAPRERVEYPVLRKRQGIWQLIKVEDITDEQFGDERYGFVKIQLTFVHLVPGAAEATTPEEQAKYRKMGHGKWCSIKCNPIVSPPGKNNKGEATNPSTLYELFRVMLNGGEPLTDEQMGRADEATLKAYAKEHGITDLAQAAVDYAADKMAEQLDALERARPQVYATPEIKIKASGEQYNKLYAVDELVEAEHRLPDWKPFERPLDPREVGEHDPECACDRCGRVIRGYEARYGERAGDWISQADVVERTIEEFGEKLCGKCVHAERVKSGKYARR